MLVVQGRIDSGPSFFDLRPGWLSKLNTMNYTDISERISTLMQEIRDTRELNARYWELNVRTQAERAAHAAREIRLLQIKEELSRMMNRSQQKATLRWQLGEKP
jgi:hypothetical protein